MSISDFDYELPGELIAQTAAEPRSSARLLIDGGSSTPSHSVVARLGDELRSGDVVVVNNTKVLPSRIRLQRSTGGKVEMLLLEPIGNGEWECLLRPGGKLRPGEHLFSSAGTQVVSVLGRRNSPSAATFSVSIDVSEEELFDLGELPLPPYISQPPSNPDRYQTVFADRAASAAAPTAGLHLTNELIAELNGAGIRFLEVELIVGIDTFRPVEVERLDDHVMHTESYRVSQSVFDEVREARRVMAVGTTSTRALESAATRGQLSGRTDLFIRPGYDWKMVDLLMTNFHQPRTTLLVMIEAFVGSRWRRLYEEAITQKYRMLSFGDAMLLNRHL
jgi:S-adenosylmethionine:tRNA ribosyltransferase-isomerase